MMCSAIPRSARYTTSSASTQTISILQPQRLMRVAEALVQAASAQGLPEAAAEAHKVLTSAALISPMLAAAGRAAEAAFAIFFPASSAAGAAVQAQPCRMNLSAALILNTR